MIQEIFLTNENYVRNLMNIDNNVQSKFLLAAIREAQEMGLQSIIGTAMLDQLKDLIGSGLINDDSNRKYKLLVDTCQLYLAYQATANLCLITNVKISNGGLQQTSDENLTVLDVNDGFTVETHYQNKADFFARRLQKFILAHIKDYPEIDACICSQMHANLGYAATTNLFLGGYRGRIRKNNCLGYIGK